MGGGGDRVMRGTVETVQIADTFGLVSVTRRYECCTPSARPPALSSQLSTKRFSPRKLRGCDIGNLAEILRES